MMPGTRGTGTGWEGLEMEGFGTKTVAERCNSYDNSCRPGWIEFQCVYQMRVAPQQVGSDFVVSAPVVA